MDEGSEHLLGKMESAPSRYSAMNVEDAKSPESNDGLLTSDEKYSSLKINKRALVIFFGVIVVAVVVIVVAVVVALYSGGLEGTPISRAKRSGVPFTMDDVFNGTYQPSVPLVSWISDDSYRTDRSGIQNIDAATGTATVVVSEGVFKSLAGEAYKLSPDQKLILYRKNKQSQYRYSTFADYYVYDIDTNKHEKIATSNGLQIQYASWAPNTNALIFIVQNDMYYIGGVKLPLPPIHKLTNTGEEHKIFNGVPDWVYQEEVLNADHAMYFSPDSRYLAYMQFNDTNVKNYVYPWYGSSKNSYPSQRKIAYPKSGTPNPTVKVKVIDLAQLPANPNQTPVHYVLQTPAGFTNIDHYVVNVGWPANNTFTVQWLNRFQNHSLTQVCSVTVSPTTTVTCTKGHEQRINDGWVDDRYNTPIFSKDKSYYLLLYPFPQAGDKGDFVHIGQLDLTANDGTVKPLTSGEWEVTKILRFDADKQIVYFESTEVSPMQRHIYSYSIFSKEKKCLTCYIDTTKGIPGVKDSACGYYHAQFSPKASYCVLHCRGPMVPQSFVYSTKDNKYNKVRDLEMNFALKQKVSNLAQTKTEFITVPSAGNKLNVKLVYPPGLDKRMPKKYAVLFSVYGGPATQNVLDTWQLGYEGGFLVRNYDLILAYVDARGTMGRGESFKHATYRDLGRREAEDVIQVARHLSSQPYVDKDKIAIWGWSYGGYLTSYVLGKSAGVFKLGMAVAPVADWRYYDSIYTERYMGLPQENKYGYEDSSVLPLLKNYKTHNLHYLIVHGTGDDNVHFQNSAQIVKKLTEEEVDYRVQFYTDRNHGLEGGGTTSHLYHLLTNFMAEKLVLNKTS